jgi:hypothetical protein
MDIDQIRLTNLLALIAAEGSQAKLAARIEKSPAQISQWVNQSKDSGTGKPRAMNTATARAIEKAYPLRAGWMDTIHEPRDPTSYYGQDANPAKYRIAEATPDSGAIAIELSNARGSCGGGSTMDPDALMPLLKEPGWFRRYNVRPEDCLAVWADGDSMAEYIVDGDIAIFDTSRCAPQSGVIFLIDHPDGLRIKVLRRDIDGSWVLESKNPDKRRFPDERIAPSHAELLKIKGRFFYRQGG